MASHGLLDVDVRYFDEHGDSVASRLAEVEAEAVVGGGPVRRFKQPKRSGSTPTSAAEPPSPPVPASKHIPMSGGPISPTSPTRWPASTTGNESATSQP